MHVRCRWAYLELQTNAAVDDDKQARAAGVLEGYLSAGILHMHVNNVARPFCDGRQALCTRIQKFLERNLGWVSSMVKKQASKDVYWHQVGKLFPAACFLLRVFEPSHSKSCSPSRLSCSTCSRTRSLRDTT